MLPLNRFLSFIELHGLFKPGHKILLAVSGGKDSVLMAHLFNEAKFDFGIAHCNFNLRGNESDEDENFTRVLATQLNVPFHVSSFDTEKFAGENKVSIQMAARQLRYNWFEKIQINHQYDYIALAHHQHDSTETILLNLIRGTGIAGLHGILPKREKLIRPLLFLGKEEIDKLVLENKLPYREDSSNCSVKYARNKLRLEVIPKLKELNPFLENTFESNSRRFQQVENFLDIQIENLRKQLFQVHPSGDVSIDLEQLKFLNPLQLLLYELFKPYNFSESVLEDLIKSWHGQPGKVFESATHCLLLDRNNLILSPIVQRYSAEALIGNDQKEVTWNSYSFIVREVTSTNFTPPTTNEFAFFDLSLLHFPLKFRQWNKGDYFYPFGMKGKKKLSDFFTSVKLPLTQKKQVPVLENGNGDILWVAGYRSDERYKIGPLTKKVIIFEQQKSNV